MGGKGEASYFGVSQKLQILAQLIAFAVKLPT